MLQESPTEHNVLLGVVESNRKKNGFLTGKASRKMHRDRNAFEVFTESTSSGWTYRNLPSTVSLLKRTSAVGSIRLPHRTTQRRIYICGFAVDRLREGVTKDGGNSLWER